MLQLYNENQESLKSICRLSLFLGDDRICGRMTKYVWRVKTRLPERYRMPCKVLARGKMNTCLVEFEDGYRVTTSRNYVMKWETMQRRLSKQALKN
jgi:hypothetical protein